MFGLKDAQVQTSAVAKVFDTGEWTDLAALTACMHESADVLERAIDAHRDAVIGTKEFGMTTKAEALVRITKHTAYHAGHLAMLVKYCDQRPFGTSRFRMLANVSFAAGRLLGSDRSR